MTTSKTNYPIDSDAMRELIDDGLDSIKSRRLVETSTMSDLLLDIRLLLTTEDKETVS